MVQVAAVVVAAGQGVRAGGDLPKQFREIGGTSLLRHALLKFVENPEIDAVQLVIRPEDGALVSKHTGDIGALPPVFGGRTWERVPSPMS